MDACCSFETLKKITIIPGVNLTRLSSEHQALKPENFYTEFSSFCGK